MPDVKTERLPRKRIAKGPKRPAYLGEKDLDRVMIMFVALISEVLVATDRLDTHEILLEREGRLTKAMIEEFRESPEIEEAREQRRLALMRRVFRVLNDEFEEADTEAVQGQAA